MAIPPPTLPQFGKLTTYQRNQIEAAKACVVPDVIESTLIQTLFPEDEELKAIPKAENQDQQATLTALHQHIRETAEKIRQNADPYQNHRVHTQGKRIATLLDQLPFQIDSSRVNNLVTLLMWSSPHK